MTWGANEEKEKMDVENFIMIFWYRGPTISTFLLISIFLSECWKFTAWLHLYICPYTWPNTLQISIYALISISGYTS